VLFLSVVDKAQTSMWSATVSGRSITRQIDGTSQGVVLNDTSVLPKPQQIPLIYRAFLCREINICELR